MGKPAIAVLGTHPALGSFHVIDQASFGTDGYNKLERIIMRPGHAATLVLKILQGMGKGNPSYAHESTGDLFDALKDVKLEINLEGTAVVLQREAAAQLMYGLNVRLRSENFEMGKGIQSFRSADAEKRMAYLNDVWAEFDDYRALLEAFRKAYSSGNGEALLTFSPSAEGSRLETLADAR